MGGSHIDGAIIKKGKIIHTIKKPINKEDLFQSLFSTLKELLYGYDTSEIKRINLSTTVSTNAIVEKTTEPVGMIIQEGPGLHREFSECYGEKIFVSGYVDHRGRVIRSLNRDQIKSISESFKEKGITSCAIISKFSTRNPNQEIEISKMLSKDFETISLGHRLSGHLNFPRRVNTAYLNAAVSSTFSAFAQHIKASLEKEDVHAPVYILKADAGTMDMQTAKKRPVETILSGPAASFMGINALQKIDTDAVLLDVGGTTTDIFFLADGVGLFEPAGAKISEFDTLVRAIYSVSIGLGGDSFVQVKDGHILIGPKRKGKPYAFRGPVPTPTDAMIVLELMEVEDVAIRKKAEEAMLSLEKELRMDSKKIAREILETMALVIKDKIEILLKDINARPVYTVKELLHGKKIEPISIHIIGGPAGILAPILEKHIHLPCNCPANYQVANAIGAALAKPTAEITMTVDTPRGILAVPEQGIYEKINANYSLEDAKKRALQLLIESIIKMGEEKKEINAEITEASSFNMVSGFYTTGKNMRIKAQIKPGYIYKLKGGDNDAC